MNTQGTQEETLLNFIDTCQELMALLELNWAQNEIIFSVLGSDKSPQSKLDIKPEQLQDNLLQIVTIHPND